MTINVRLARAEDAEKIEQLFESNHDVWGVPMGPQFSEKIPELVNNYLYNANRKLIIAYDENDILSSLGMHYWTGLPYWTLIGVRTNKVKKFNWFNLQQNGLADALKLAYNIAEENKRYRYYQLTAVSQYQAGQRIWKKAVPEQERYLETIDTIIPANTLSEFATFRSIANDKIWPIDIMIRSFTLKPEYRPSFQII